MNTLCNNNKLLTIKLFKYIKYIYDNTNKIYKYCYLKDNY